MIALTHARVLLPSGWREDVCVVLEGERIAAVTAGPPAGAEQVRCDGRMLVPGFLDTQVNGGGGRLLNDDPSVETVAAIAAAHRPFGTTGLLPTLISDDLPVVAAAIAAVDAAIAARVPGVLGVHLEGPFLSVARRGIHRADKVRALTDEALALLCSARRGVTMVTVAPESVTPAQVATLAGAGVIVSLGHSDAPYEQVRACIEAGATGFTHLYNAMSQLAGRAPGMVGAALESDETFAGVIADGHHLHAASLRVAIRAKGEQRLMLVTDAMPSVGSAEDSFLLQGKRIHRAGDMLHDDAGTLAGSTLTMAGAVHGAVAQGRVPLDAAIRMASATPASFLGLSGDTGSIAPGLRADLVLMDDACRVHDSWIGGERASF
ncbi:N-acetylglucosamine-6-phosphate deacetylase [Sphingomonas aracearum]|uniref:N-acetylglucosamine-6-phosphate deacetylase n=1 Tax=Sphingomonas aracearum TaxID=2283317 RepID=A0A369VTU7_9SPHN|nr:N-acetylglucosamine-6-phosphate deacetylase [Sphingomonas aracearum]RDE05816.1 N-acetylglucosamine-6-phosphate deacetylase [Sphingomonas aracearum]